MFSMNRKAIFSLLSLVLVFALVVVGCSSPAKTDSAAPAKAKTRTIEHAMGKTEVPENPKRVVVLTNEGIEAVLSMGVKPVGAVKGFTTDGKPWYKHLEKDLQGVQVVGDEHQPNLETIAGLKPDLIIGNKMRQEKVYEQLSAIAPTVFSETLRGDWKKNFELYSKALNKEAEGQKVIAAYDQKVEEVKKNAGDLLKQKVSMVRFMPGKIRIYQQASFSGNILQQVGFARPDNQKANDLAIEVTKEQIPDMDGDILFYFTFDTADQKSDGKSGAQLEQEITQDPLWKNLNAVKNNRAFKVDDVIWNTAGGVKAANLMLDDLNNYINQLKK